MHCRGKFRTPVETLRVLLAGWRMERVFQRRPRGRGERDSSRRHRRPIERTPGNARHHQGHNRRNHERNNQGNHGTGYTRRQQPVHHHQTGGTALHIQGEHGRPTHPHLSHPHRRLDQLPIPRHHHSCARARDCRHNRHEWARLRRRLPSRKTTDITCQTIPTRSSMYQLDKHVDKGRWRIRMPGTQSRLGLSTARLPFHSVSFIHCERQRPAQRHLHQSQCTA